jgi:glycosyltransferase involved in cell wall biosynthesis
LIIGCHHLPPKGGVAQVLYIYEKYIYEEFRKISDSRSGLKIIKILQFIAAYLKLLFILISSHNIKIVHIHTSSYNSFFRSSYFVKITKFFKRKVILHVHGGEFEIFYNANKTKVKSVIDKCDCIIALSDSWKTFFKNTFPNKYVEVLDNPVEPAQIKNLDSDGLVHILYLGLITESKGVFDLLEAIVSRKELFINRIKLHIGGNGDVNLLKEYIEMNSLHDIVVYEGWLTGDRKIEMMNRCSVYVLPSYAEGLPVSILEAMSYGQFIISTKVGGIPELISSSIGVLINPGDISALSDSLLETLSNEFIDGTKKVEIIKAADRFHPDNIAKKLNQIYRTLQ